LPPAHAAGEFSGAPAAEAELSLRANAFDDWFAFDCIGSDLVSISVKVLIGIAIRARDGREAAL
jgi:hypothetical protein